MSPVAAFTQGFFLPVIGDPAQPDPAGVRRIILCAGKMYYDLADRRGANGRPGTAVIRVERLYPLPAAEILAEVSRYPAGAEVVWVQEEPANMGAWPTMALQLPGLLRRQLRLISPPASSAPARGSTVTHGAEHKAVIETALSHD
jgi:2-oxoglutarate dehydrogenase E1 component